MRLTNTTVYSSPTGLYVTSGDHNLAEISGADVAIVEEVLTGLAANEPLHCIFERLKATHEDDLDYFNEILAWLLEQNIVQTETTVAMKPVPTFLHAPYLPESARADLLAALTSYGTQAYCLAPTYQEAAFILLLAPAFEYQAALQRLNQYAYQHDIPVCHVGVDTGTFTIGPLVSPGLRTPCLSCYLRRKLANLKNPEKTLTFIQHANKTRLTTADPRRNPYLRIALTHLAVELDSFFKYDRQFSPLLSTSVTFEHFAYQLTKSKVLRVPDCSVCNVAPAYAAFNP